MPATPMMLVVDMLDDGSIYTTEEYHEITEICDWFWNPKGNHFLFGSKIDWENVVNERGGAVHVQEIKMCSSYYP